jgi:hypothetical protein
MKQNKITEDSVVLLRINPLTEEREIAIEIDGTDFVSLKPN